MKLRYILSAFAVVALAFTACQREDATSADLANATVSNSYVRIPLDGSAQPTISNRAKTSGVPLRRGPFPVSLRG